MLQEHPRMASDGLQEVQNESQRLKDDSGRGTDVFKWSKDGQQVAPGCAKVTPGCLK